MEDFVRAFVRQKEKEFKDKLEIVTLEFIKDKECRDLKMLFGTPMESVMVMALGELLYEIIYKIATPIKVDPYKMFIEVLEVFKNDAGIHNEMRKEKNEYN